MPEDIPIAIKITAEVIGSEEVSKLVENLEKLSNISGRTSRVIEGLGTAARRTTPYIEGLSKPRMDPTTLKYYKILEELVLDSSRSLEEELRILKSDSKERARAELLLGRYGDQLDTIIDSLENYIQKSREWESSVGRITGEYRKLSMIQKLSKRTLDLFSRGAIDQSTAIKTLSRATGLSAIEASKLLQIQKSLNVPTLTVTDGFKKLRGALKVLVDSQIDSKKAWEILGPSITKVMQDIGMSRQQIQTFRNTMMSSTSTAEQFLRVQESLITPIYTTSQGLVRLERILRGLESTQMSGREIWSRYGKELTTVMRSMGWSSDQIREFKNNLLEGIGTVQNYIQNIRTLNSTQQNLISPTMSVSDGFNKLETTLKSLQQTQLQSKEIWNIMGSSLTKVMRDMGWSREQIRGFKASLEDSIQSGLTFLSVQKALSGPTFSLAQGIQKINTALSILEQTGLSSTQMWSYYGKSFETIIREMGLGSIGVRDFKRALDESTDTAKQVITYLAGIQQGLSEVNRAERQFRAELGASGRALQMFGNALLWVGLGSMFIMMSVARLRRSMRGVETAAYTLKRAYVDLYEAQKTYQETLIEYGPRSEEFMRASLALEEANWRVKNSEEGVRAAIEQRYLAWAQLIFGSMPTYISSSIALAQALFFNKIISDGLSVSIGKTAISISVAGTESSAATIKVLGLSLSFKELALAIGLATAGLNIAIGALVSWFAAMEQERIIEDMRNQTDELLDSIYSLEYGLTGGSLVDSIFKTVDSLEVLRRKVNEISFENIPSDLVMNIRQPEEYIIEGEVQVDTSNVEEEISKLELDKEIVYDYKIIEPRIEEKESIIKYIPKIYDLEDIPDIKQNIIQEIIKADIEVPEEVTQYIVQKIIEARIPEIEDKEMKIIQLLDTVDIPELEDQTQIVHLEYDEIFPIEDRVQTIKQEYIQTDIPEVEDQVQYIYQKIIPPDITELEVVSKIEGLEEDRGKILITGIEDITPKSIKTRDLYGTGFEFSYGEARNYSVRSLVAGNVEGLTLTDMNTKLLYIIARNSIFLQYLRGIFWRSGGLLLMILDSILNALGIVSPWLEEAIRIEKSLEDFDSYFGSLEDILSGSFGDIDRTLESGFRDIDSGIIVENIDEQLATSRDINGVVSSVNELSNVLGTKFDILNSSNKDIQTTASNTSFLINTVASAIPQDLPQILRDSSSGISSIAYGIGSLVSAIPSDFSTKLSNASSGIWNIATGVVDLIDIFPRDFSSLIKSSKIGISSLVSSFTTLLGYVPQDLDKKLTDSKEGIENIFGSVLDLINVFPSNFSTIIIAMMKAGIYSGVMLLGIFKSIIDLYNLVASVGNALIPLVDPFATIEVDLSDLVNTMDTLLDVVRNIKFPDTSEELQNMEKAMTTKGSIYIKAVEPLLVKSLTPTIVNIEPIEPVIEIPDRGNIYINIYEPVVKEERDIYRLAEIIKYQLARGTYR
jgi:hypothetical protein